MVRKSKNPLEGKTQKEIDAIMAIRPLKNMTVEQMCVYKRVRMDAWQLNKLKNGGKAPKKVPKKAPSAPKKAISTPPPILFVKKKKSQINDKTSSIILPSRSVARLSDGKIPRWVDVPDLTDKLKEWSNNRTILISFNGHIKICTLNWLEDEKMPTVIGGNVPNFHLAWSIACIAVKYGFIRSHKRDGIAKHNSSTDPVANAA